MNQNNEMVTINKFEYDDLKSQDKAISELMSSDFAIKIYRCAVLPPSHPNYNDDRIEIELYSIDFSTLNNYSIQIEGKVYSIRNQILFNRIKQFVRNNLDVLIDWSKRQTNSNLDNNYYEGGVSRSIQIKYGQLIVNINGQVQDLGESCDKFINEIKTLIITDGEKNDDEYLNELMENYESTKPSELNDELKKYFKLYEEKFGRKAYIPEPHGTEEMAINAIKTCLEKNKDLLDEIYYPNWSEDSKNGVLY